MGVLSDVVDSLAGGYNLVKDSLPGQYSSIFNVFIFALLISVYSIFTWKFYRNLSKKDLLSLNLSQYNHSSHPFTNKFFATILYLIEYIIILPFLIFFWFAVLALIIIILSEEQTANQILLISAAIVASIRILSYYKEELSRDLAKMFPFTILAIFILSPSFFSVERILTRILDIPTSITNIFAFLVMIIVVEILFRLIETVAHLFKTPEEQEYIEEKKAMKKIQEEDS